MTIRVTIPEEDWRALNEFVGAQRPFPFGIEAAVRAAQAAETDRIIAFRSADAVKALIDRITSYARTWDMPWGVPLNRMLPRLYKAISAASP
jgi:hypothetical protein